MTRRSVNKASGFGYSGGPNSVRPDAVMYDFDWDETSGADHPANLEEGWMVMKSADMNSLVLKAQELLNVNKSTDGAQGTDPASYGGKGGGQPNMNGQLAQVHQQLHQAAEQPEQCTPGEISDDLEGYDWSTAPPDIRRAVRLVIAHLRADDEDTQRGNPNSSDQGNGANARSTNAQSAAPGANGPVDTGKTPTQKNVDSKDASRLRKALTKVLGRGEPKEVPFMDFDDGMNDPGLWTRDEEMQLITKSIAQAWPNFVPKIAAVRNASDDDTNKATLIRKAVGELAQEAGEVYKAERFFSDKRRKAYAKQGIAMSDGSYPIPDCDAHRRARMSIGRAPEEKRAAVRAHINSRGKTLGCKNGDDNSD